jgi:hypothetical protein
MIVNTNVYICDRCEKATVDMQVLNCSVTQKINSPCTEEGWEWFVIDYKDVLLCPECAKTKDSWRK